MSGILLLLRTLTHSSPDTPDRPGQAAERKWMNERRWGSRTHSPPAHAHVRYVHSTSSRSHASVQVDIPALQVPCCRSPGSKTSPARVHTFMSPSSVQATIHCCPIAPTLHSRLDFDGSSLAKDKERLPPSMRAEGRLSSRRTREPMPFVPLMPLRFSDDVGCMQGTSCVLARQPAWSPHAWPPMGSFSPVHPSS